MDAKKPFTIVDFLASKLATYNNAEIMELSQILFEPRMDSIIYRYFCTYLDFDFCSPFFERVESEVNTLAEKASIQGHPQPQIAGVTILINRFKHLAFYPRLLGWGSRIMFLDADQEHVSDLQFEWAALYIDFLASSKFCGRSKSYDNLLLDLYFMYLDGQISLEEYLACLHALWVSVAINTLCVFHDISWNIR